RTGFAVVRVSADRRWVLTGRIVPLMTLRGRDRECAVINGVLAEARQGHSGVLLVRGAPGVGKSALREHAAESADDFQLVRAACVESEMELAFAGLHQLSAPLLDRLDDLTDPQRNALATAFGLTSGDAPDRFFVGLAVLSLFSEVSGER